MERPQKKPEVNDETESVRKAGVDVDTELPSGQPDESLVDFAKTGPTRLVVIASLGVRLATR